MVRPVTLLISGLLIGALLGLYLAWFVFPLELVDVTPLDLEESYQVEYLHLIAATYGADGDLELAQARIQSLGRIDVNSWIMNETLNQIILDPTSQRAADLVLLAEALGISNPNFDVVREERSP